MGRGVRGAPGASLAFDVLDARGGGVMQVWVAAIAEALGLAACDPWHCDFHVRGACVEFEEDPPDLAVAERRVTALLDVELPFWGSSSLSGWRIQYRNDAECLLSRRAQRRVHRLPREDPLGSDPAGRGRLLRGGRAAPRARSLRARRSDVLERALDVEAQFAPMVWDREDAAPECVRRYHGIDHGMWPVRIDRF